MKHNITFSRSLFVSAFIALGASTLAIWTSPLQASETKGPTVAKNKGANRTGAKRRGQRRNPMEMIAKELGLTEAQKARIKPIMEESRQRSMKVRADKSLTPEQKRKKMREIRTGSWKKVDPILTTAQRKKIAEMREKRGPRAGAKKQG